MIVRQVTAGLFILGAIGATAFAQSPGVDLEWGVKIPMADGVQLNATVYRPADGEPVPVVFTLTPYQSDGYHERAWYFAQHGYVYALVDVRGRGNSGGEFDPFRNEGRDGYEAVEWFARQPWSNGKVAMWGGSYAGFDQWTVIKEQPPHLTTIVPAASGYFGLDFPILKNIFRSYAIQWLTLTSGVMAQFNLFGEGAFWSDKYAERYYEHLPFRSLDSLVGNPSRTFQTWLDHPHPDAYWDALAPTPEQYARITQPILTITGHYDGDQPGALRYYTEHMRHGTPDAIAQHYLVMGPWDHAGTRTPRADVGGLHFGDASLVDLNQLHLEWYDWTMKDGQRPPFLHKRVAYYVTGADVWKYAESPRAIPATPTRFYLTSTAGRANGVFVSGSLQQERPAPSPPDRYTYDPLDTRPAAVEREGRPHYLTDQTDALQLFGNGLVYHSDPFADSTEISGIPRLSAWLSLDVPDTDFWVTLYEILPDGGSVLLTETSMRARYRESARAPKLVPLNQVVRYDFDDFMFISRRVAKGSRLRLFIRSPNSIMWEKNYNSGGVVAEETATDARTAHVTLYHDAEHPSMLEVPIVSGRVQP